MNYLLGMHDPDRIDPTDKPFSYYANPNDILKPYGATVASEVTPEGYIFTGFGELMFFIGNPPTPAVQRIHTLHDGCMPAIEYDIEHDGVRHDFQLFAADLGGAMAGIPVNFARITITNRTDEARAAWFSTGWRFRGDVNTGYTQLADYRFGQQFRNLPEELVGEQHTFDPGWKYRFEADGVIRDERLVYCFPTQPAPRRTFLAPEDCGLRMRRYFSGEIEGEPDPAVNCDPHTPLGMVMYLLRLEPGQSETLTYTLPIVPLPVRSEHAQQVREADYDRAFADTMAFWGELVADHPPLRFPEAKVQDYLVGNTIANLQNVDLVGNDTVVNVNEFQYHSWYGGGNINNIMRGYEYMGLTDIAREGLLFLRRQQSPDGSFRVAHHQETLYFEMWGYNLWGWMRHHELTRDRGFLETVYPGVLAAMEWEQAIVAEDALGLWHPATVADDAYLKDCRQTGQHFWGLIGLLACVYLAEQMGRDDDAERFRAEYGRFRAGVMTLLDAQTAQTGGYIPPSLERTTQGNDWDNLLTLYPLLLFAPDDQRVEATLRTVRKRYQEGLLSYTWPSAIAREGDEFVFNEQPGIHYWQTPNNAQASLVRGTAWDQEWAVRELYAMLVHTSSTHLPAEFGTIPWSTRGYSHVFNIIPQSTSSAKTIELLRNMLVREQGEELYLLSAVSPEWLQPGKEIIVRDEPSSFGPLSMTVAATADSIVVELPGGFRNAPERMLLRVPWFCEVDAAELDGAAVEPDDGHFSLPLTGGTLTIRGRIRPDTPAMSYEQAVLDYKTEYRRRWEHFRRTGSRGPEYDE